MKLQAVMPLHRWFQIIILLCLSLRAFASDGSGVVSTGRAATDMKEPFIISGDWTSTEGKCRIVTLESFTEKNGRLYAQTGIGWVIHSEGQRYILTPAHVVTGGEVLVGRCGKDGFLLKLKSRSETKDLALLEPYYGPTDWSFPLISYVQREHSLQQIPERVRELVGLMHPNHFATSWSDLIQRQTRNYYVTPGNPPQLVPSYNADVVTNGATHFEKKIRSLVVETLSIKPGYSGAPLLAQVPSKGDHAKNFFKYPEHFEIDNQSYLFGMLTNVEINGSRSIGISIEDILETLPALLQSSDPDIDVWVTMTKSPLRLRYATSIQGQAVVRSQELIHTKNGREQRYQEICNDTTAEASGWEKTKDANLTILQLMRKMKGLPEAKASSSPSSSSATAQTSETPLLAMRMKGGGDYGEGGGSAIMTAKDMQLMHPLPRTPYSGGSLASYKSISSCKVTAIQDPLGRKVDTLAVNGKVHKVTNLIEAFDALSGNSKGSDWCQTFYLQSGNGNEVNYRDRGEPYIYGRTDGIASSRPTRHSNGMLKCLSPKGAREIQLDTKEMKIDVQTNEALQVSGQITIFGKNKTCTVQVGPKNSVSTNRWKQSIRSDDLDMDIQTGSEGRLLSIKLLRLAPQCQWSDQKLWMEEQNFLSEDLHRQIFRLNFGGAQ